MRAWYGHAAMQYLQPMHFSGSTSTTPESVTYVACVGHTAAQGASSQCWHWVGTISLYTFGYVPVSSSWNLMNDSPGSRWFLAWQARRQA